ncbi:oxygenase MpaB family protein [Gordonia sp. (in: high G+C Gram-positive bacteria)]|uniref:oxygenase MpaB family protein n=1 Tax=Gordonia sp. (in: high G+C Gram-positive bacteria) TaxID=84139 RepID=UPI003F95CFB7
MEPITAHQAAAITGARNWDAVAADHPERAASMAAGLMRGDRLADAVIAEFFDRQGAPDAMTWQDVMAALEGADSPSPPALTEFLDAVRTPPTWYDPALARAGAMAWWRFGSLQSSTLYQSLIYGYQARGFTRPLSATGRLTDGTWDRVQSTARWVALATAPEYMEVGRAGWVQTLRIRLVHAMVRHHLVHRQGWDTEQWGVPINQTYSQFTITAGFLALPLRIGHDFGLRYSPAEREAITHMWRWIGSVMGVDDDLLPRSFADAAEIDRVARAFRMEPDPDARTLVSALLDDGFRTEFPLPLPPAVANAINGAVHTVTRPVLRTLFASVSTRWVDEDIASAMGLRATPLHNVVALARPLVRSREVLRALGVFGSDTRVAQRELRLVTTQLGIDLADPDAARYGRVA